MTFGTKRPDALIVASQFSLVASGRLHTAALNASVSDGFFCASFAFAFFSVVLDVVSPLDCCFFMVVVVLKSMYSPLLTCSL